MTDNRNVKNFLKTFLFYTFDIQGEFFKKNI